MVERAKIDLITLNKILSFFYINFLKQIYSKLIKFCTFDIFIIIYILFGRSSPTFDCLCKRTPGYFS